MLAVVASCGDGGGGSEADAGIAGADAAPLPPCSGSGLPDVSFGDGGELVLDIAGGLRGFHVSDDGSITARGSMGEIVRYGRAGVLDPAFGVGGRATAPVDLISGALLVADDGTLYVVGQCDGALCAAHLDGSFGYDAGFGVQGMVEVATHSELYGAALWDGRLVIASHRRSPFQPSVVVLAADGTLHDGFDGDGILDLDPGQGLAGPLAIDPQNNLLVVSNANDQNTLRRVGPAGNVIEQAALPAPLDGFVALGYMAARSDGSAVLSGDLDTRGVLMATRPDLSPDPGFGSGGMLDTELSGSTFPNFSVASQDDGKLLIAATTDAADPSTLVLRRYDTSGQIDTSFGGGDVSVPIGGQVLANNQHAWVFSVAGDRVLVVTPISGGAVASRFCQ